MNDIYNKIKNDMNNNPEDEQYLFLIKIKGDKNINDAFNRIKASGALINKNELINEIDMNLNKIKGNTKMKKIFIEVKKPNGILLIKVEEGTELDDIIYEVENSEILEGKPEKKMQNRYKYSK